MSTRVCGNCSHRASIPHRTHIEVRCDVDNHEISGLDDTSMWCKKWAKGEPPKCEKDTEADRKMQRFVDYNIYYCCIKSNRSRERVTS